jgi:hypothetical protein
MKINVVHASSINMSPHRRLTLYINVCPVDNRPDPTTPPKVMAPPGWPRSRANLSPLVVVLPQECMGQLASFGPT